MFTYFRGWKRKAGLVTIAVASLVAAFWIRSWSMADEIIVSHRKDNLNRVLSSEGVLYFIAYRGASSKLEIRRRWTTSPNSGPALHNSPAIRWIWRFGEFGFARMDATGERFRLLSIPYSAIVGPLALLSTWLLAPKRRHLVKNVPTTEPAA